jgi:hypothetical protein
MINFNINYNGLLNVFRKIITSAKEQEDRFVKIA